MGKRIVLSTIGSLGDLHPYMAIALELKARGHQSVIATSDYYQEKVVAAGIEFCPIRPKFNQDQMLETIKRVMNLKAGPEYIIRQMIVPHCRDTYNDLTKAVEGAQMLVSQSLIYAAPLVVEKQKLKWVSAILQPLSFFSGYDTLVIAPAPWLSTMNEHAPWLFRQMLRLMKRTTVSWSAPIHQLRKEIGLPPTQLNPIFEGQHSPQLVLALYSDLLGKLQPDWPPIVIITGFPFYDSNGSDDLLPELEDFLASGEPPIVFTLGSAAVQDAGQFYHQSAKAAEILGKRAILLIGDNRENLPEKLPGGIAAFPYAPFSRLFPRAAAIVHQGGIGTTGQALRSGKPMLIMPCGTDQPDNAARVERIGAGRTISRDLYNAKSAAHELNILLTTPKYTERSALAAKQIHSENGIKSACDAIESQFE